MKKLILVLSLMTASCEMPCSLKEDCSEFGWCGRAEDGRCAATEPEHCRKAEICKNNNYCYLGTGGVCINGDAALGLQ